MGKNDAGELARVYAAGGKNVKYDANTGKITADFDNADAVEKFIRANRGATVVTSGKLKRQFFVTGSRGQIRWDISPIEPMTKRDFLGQMKL